MKWIDIRKEQPYPNQEVLIFDKFWREIERMEYMTGNNDDKYSYYWVGRADTIPVEYAYRIHRIIWWRPLPDLPKGKE